MPKVETILQYENINRSQFAGVEVMANVRLARGLFVRANYNYIYQTDDAPRAPPSISSRVRIPRRSRPITVL